MCAVCKVCVGMRDKWLVRMVTWATTVSLAELSECAGTMMSQGCQVEYSKMSLHSLKNELN